jgi:hypothetical protein
MEALANAGAQGVILGCTEFNMLVQSGDSPIPTFDLTGSQFGGEGGIRTHVGALAPHPISSRCRCDRFGTSPECGIIS